MVDVDEVLAERAVPVLEGQAADQAGVAPVGQAGLACPPVAFVPVDLDPVQGALGVGAARPGGLVGGAECQAGRVGGPEGGEPGGRGGRDGDPGALEMVPLNVGDLLPELFGGEPVLGVEDGVPVDVAVAGDLPAAVEPLGAVEPGGEGTGADQAPVPVLAQEQGTVTGPDPAGAQPDGPGLAPGIPASRRRAKSAGLCWLIWISHANLPGTVLVGDPGVLETSGTAHPVRWCARPPDF